MDNATDLTPALVLFERVRPADVDAAILRLERWIELLRTIKPACVDGAAQPTLAACASKPTHRVVDLPPSSAKELVLKTLRGGGEHTIQSLVEATGRAYGSIAPALQALVMTRQIVRVGRGVYALQANAGKA